jgi:hypothetical protein
MSHLPAHVNANYGRCTIITFRAFHILFLVLLFSHLMPQPTRLVIFSLSSSPPTPSSDTTAKSHSPNTDLPSPCQGTSVRCYYSLNCPPSASSHPHLVPNCLLYSCSFGRALGRQALGPSRSSSGHSPRTRAGSRGRVPPSRWKVVSAVQKKCGEVKCWREGKGWLTSSGRRKLKGLWCCVSRFQRIAHDWVTRQLNLGGHP